MYTLAEDVLSFQDRVREPEVCQGSATEQVQEAGLRPLQGQLEFRRLDCRHHVNEIVQIAEHSNASKELVKLEEPTERSWSGGSHPALLFCAAPCAAWRRRQKVVRQALPLSTAVESRSPLWGQLRLNFFQRHVALLCTDFEGYQFTSVHG